MWSPPRPPDDALTLQRSNLRATCSGAVRDWYGPREHLGPTSLAGVAGVRVLVVRERHGDKLSG